MRFTTYTKYIPELADAVNLQGLLDQLTDFLLQSGFAGQGQSFWQDESYDRLVRDGAEFQRIERYIEWNPVKAGLVARPEDFPWSSAKAD